MVNDVVCACRVTDDIVCWGMMLEDRYFAKGSEPRFKIIMVGESGVGKSALFWKYLEGEWIEGGRKGVTIIDFKIREVQIEGQSVKLYIWDTAGQERHRSMVASYFQGCQGVMLVFDLSSRVSFLATANNWFPLARTRCPEAIILLVGNKSDLSAQVSEQEASSWAAQNGIAFIATSVKQDVNVDTAFKQLSQSIFRGRQTPPKPTFALQKQRLPNKKGCC